MVRVSVENLRKEFDVASGVEVAVDDVSFAAEQGEFVTIVGPSGCGKTTLLRCIAGLETPTSGEIRFDGEDVTQVIPQRRNVSMVFQNIAVYSHMTAADNIQYPLKIRGVDESEREQRLREAATVLQIEEYLDKHPTELSGGQRQRVALARSLVQHPNVFLFDEPTSNLDAKLKVEIRKEIQKVAQETEQTMVYVTHDQEEAMTMSDQIVVMNDGDIMQLGSPEEVYQTPANRFVASFIGTPSINLLTGTCAADRFDVADGDSVAADALSVLPEDEYTLGFRPGVATLTDPGEGAVDGEIQVVETIGDERIVYLESEQGEVRVVSERERDSLPEGETFGVRPDVSRLHLFDADTGQRVALGEPDQQVASSDAEP